MRSCSRTRSPPPAGARRARSATTRASSGCQAAALALGESRVPDALALLRDLWERNDDAELRRTALLAIATLRHDQALEFLLALIAEGIGPSARDAIEALAIYKDDVALCERVRNTAERREDLDLSGALEKAF